MQGGHAAFNLFGRSSVGQGGDFQHHLFGVDQLQVAAREAVVGAVDEHRLFADQGFGARVGQRIEQQGCVAGGGVRIGCSRTVKQLVAINRTAFVHDGLAGDDGNVLVNGFYREGRSFRGVLFRCARHGVCSSGWRDSSVILDP
ncbi:hypothetical protein D3C87_1512210 [compost metagenome]